MTSEEVLEQMENEEVLCDYCEYKYECKHTMPFKCDTDDLKIQKQKSARSLA